MRIILLSLTLSLALPLFAHRIESGVGKETSRFSFEGDHASFLVVYDWQSRSASLSRLSLDWERVSYGVDGWNERSSLSSFDSWVFHTRYGSLRASGPFPDPSMPTLAGYILRFPQLTIEYDAFSYPSKNRKDSSDLLHKVTAGDVSGGTVLRMELQSGCANSVWEVVATERLGITGYVDGNVQIGNFSLGVGYGFPKWPLSYYVSLDDGNIHARFERRYGVPQLYRGNSRSERRSWAVSFSSSPWSATLSATKRDRRKARITFGVTRYPFSAKATLYQGKVSSWNVAWRNERIRLSYGSEGFTGELTLVEGPWKWTVAWRRGKRVRIRLSYEW